VNRYGMLLALLWTGVGFAGQSIDERRTVADDALVVVKNVQGEVEVRVGEPGEVRLTGTLGSGTRGLEVSDGGNRLVIEVKYPRNSRDVEDTDLYLRVPEGVSREIETVSADVTVDGPRGERIEVQTVSGEVEVTADPGHLDLKSVSGDIGIRTQTRRIDLETVSGDLEGEDLQGEINLNTVSGEALISTRDADRAHFETVSGDLELRIGLAADGDVSISSLSGDVDLDVTPELSADVEVTSFSGSIRSDRGEVRTARHGPQKSLEFRAGDGTGRIRIESFSGDVRIRSR